VLSLRRTFFQWDDRTGKLIDIATGDVDGGRLAWVSIKTPAWDAMSAGDHDAEIDELLVALAAIAGPVWLTLHHEPEGGAGVNQPDDPGGPSAHLAMNRRVRDRMTALGIDNVALALVLMGYTFNPQSNRDPEQWWQDGVYDLLGIDWYLDAEESLITSRWLSIRAWAAGKQVDVAVGEWGMRGSDAAAGQRVREWYEHAASSHVDGLGARVVGLAAYDSEGGADGPWLLEGAQLETFQELLGDPRTAHIR
jgi:hypothetical protein